MFGNDLGKSLMMLSVLQCREIFRLLKKRLFLRLPIGFF